MARFDDGISRFDDGVTFFDMPDPEEPPIINTTRHMASNALPKNLDGLMTLAEDAADGAHTHGVTVGLLQNTEAKIRADLAALIAANQHFDNMTGDNPAMTTGVTVARSNARAFAVLLRDTLKPAFGNQASQSWVPVGFTAQSIAVPSTGEKLLPLLMSMKNFLTDNPAYEVNTTKVVLTATLAGTLHEALSATRSARNSHDTDGSTALTGRTNAEAKLRLRLRGLIGELESLLDAMDARWLAFGLKRPGAPDAPDAPANTRATALGTGQVRVQCDAAPRADYYQVWKKQTGVDADFVLTESPPMPDVILENLPVGAHLEFKLRAVNETDPGAFGDVASVTVT